jgi:hypothetical protein
MILTSCTCIYHTIDYKRRALCFEDSSNNNEKGYEIRLLGHPFRNSYLQESIYVMIANKSG